jgi:UPF0042 nucleotide-binding protein
MLADSDLDPPPQRILLVTGVLGAGKTTALRTLEDMGWEAIDNFPIRLLDRLLETEPGSAQLDAGSPLAIGFDTRTRGFDPVRTIERVKRLTARPDLTVTTLFLDCGGSELERRYNETRRRHPMSEDKPAATGIAAERELLEPLRRWAEPEEGAAVGCAIGPFEGEGARQRCDATDPAASAICPISQPTNAVP